MKTTNARLKRAQLYESITPHPGNDEITDRKPVQWLLGIRDGGAGRASDHRGVAGQTCRDGVTLSAYYNGDEVQQGIHTLHQAELPGSDSASQVCNM